jgi:amino acid transporter
MKKEIKTIFCSLMIIFVFCSFSLPVHAIKLIDNANGDKNVQDFQESSGFSTAPAGGLGPVTETIIKGFLSLLAIIFLIMIIIAGYGWMMAGGEEAKVEKSKDTIKRAIIGLIITVSSYLITYFVFNNIPM